MNRSDVIDVEDSGPTRPAGDDEGDIANEGDSKDLDGESWDEEAAESEDAQDEHKSDEDGGHDEGVGRRTSVCESVDHNRDNRCSFQRWCAAPTEQILCQSASMELWVQLRARTSMAHASATKHEKKPCATGRRTCFVRAMSRRHR